MWTIIAIGYAVLWIVVIVLVAFSKGFRDWLN